MCFKHSTVLGFKRYLFLFFADIYIVVFIFAPFFSHTHLRLTMTSQIQEILVLHGMTMGMEVQPLDSYFELSGEPSPFVAPHKDNWRGYVGKWTIEDNKLYLIELSGFGNDKPLGMQSIFPNQDRVFADWFSGEIKIASGVDHFILSIFYGVDSEFQVDWYLIIRNGIVVSTRILEDRDVYSNGTLNLFNPVDSEKVVLFEGEIKEADHKESYILVSEQDGTGYIVGNFDDFEKAKKEMTRLKDAYNTSWNNPNVELYEKRMGFKTYKVHKSCDYFSAGNQCICHDCLPFGIATYTVAIFSGNSEGFSVEGFMFERGNSIFLYNIEDCMKEEIKFFKDHSFLMAN